ncbi:SEC-C metal-binding domain-containing protein, partial [Protofrankia symbiont of Coriaria ruscifolia]|uniref:SEC-C metal-binding domain-containing protein n=1 Tax=Protofrankia symbiont of Coriaria ruscifolia TaxID=1306542 RepID=UPI001F5F72BA
MPSSSASGSSTLGLPADGGSSDAGARSDVPWTGAGEPPAVGLRSPCPCGSGRRYKACHGVRRRPAPILRPFAGRRR